MFNSNVLNLMKKLTTWLALVICAADLRAAPSSPPPPASQNLILAAPIRTWDEAVPLGNGLTGGLLWGEGNLVRLSLDRGDLWEPYHTLDGGSNQVRKGKVVSDAGCAGYVDRLRAQKVQLEPLGE